MGGRAASPAIGKTRVMTETREERVGEAREQLGLANRQWDDAAAAAWDPPDAADCVSKCFYAFENAVVAAARRTTEGRQILRQSCLAGAR